MPSIMWVNLSRAEGWPSTSGKRGSPAEGFQIEDHLFLVLQQLLTFKLELEHWVCRFTSFYIMWANFLLHIHIVLFFWRTITNTLFLLRHMFSMGTLTYTVIGIKKMAQGSKPSNWDSRIPLPTSLMSSPIPSARVSRTLVIYDV